MFDGGIATSSNVIIMPSEDGCDAMQMGIDGRSKVAETFLLPDGGKKNSDRNAFSLARSWQEVHEPKLLSFFLLPAGGWKPGHAPPR